MQITLAVSRHAAKPHVVLPLFEAAERARVRALPLAARRLARRHGLPSATARTVAEAAGLGDRR
jgi:hypothetical protein